MITKIAKIEDFAVFKDFVWDETVYGAERNPLQFKKINMIYGRNYSGKTTMSRLIRSLETGKIPENYNNPRFSVLFDNGQEINQTNIAECNKNIRVFNEDFVRENLLFMINPHGNIQPFAVLGNNNTVIEKEISEIEAILGSNEKGKETGLYAEYVIAKERELNAKRSYTKAVNELDSKMSEKATSRNFGIKYNSDKYGDQNYSKLKLKADIKTVLSPSFVTLLPEHKVEYGKLIMEQTKPLIPDLPSLNLSFAHICKQARELLSVQIGTSYKIAELLRDAALNEWVRAGCNQHYHMRNTCAFCGGELTDERWSKLRAHNQSAGR